MPVAQQTTPFAAANALQTGTFKNSTLGVFINSEWSTFGIQDLGTFGTEHVSGAGSERKTERSGPKIE